ncbi:peptidase M29 [Oceanibacterium hippocampi]|uniref:2,5-dihydroxypyridine 5,6-dioxygenase n=1 Tax=Oceanibacterium hippocampi TaxID=745714 RepID=A0A1Y5U413_9PROT|nr:peptidase M29 [Oceanibacterium hippocampi]SLN76336.1 2,5-dihydroxypyridine 5,6-dioxygenase [Oceanibacterium hippocampi]
MLTDRLEGKWLDCFEEVLALSAVKKGESVAILSESQSRALNVQLVELALHRLGAKAYHVIVPTPAQTLPVPVRSTGASNALAGQDAVVKALAAADMVVDLTVEGLLHAPELPGVVRGGTRMLFISNEHPEALERLKPDPELGARVDGAIAMMKAASELRVTSPGGTDLIVDVSGAPVGGARGFAAAPKSVDHWPGGLVACFPRAGSVNGRIVLDRGDLNLTFKRYVEEPITLQIEDDFVTTVEGRGVDAELLRSYFEVWGDRNAYATSHVGWGLNERARWDAVTMYDKRDMNGTEQRTFAGNFLYSTGANQFAKRFTLGHFDLPMRHCTVLLDNRPVVEDGKLVG